VTKPQIASLVTLGGIGLAIAVTDVWFLVDGEDQNTYSSVLRDQSWSAGGIGFLAAHLVHKSKPGKDVSGWITGSAGILALFGSEVLGGGLFGMALGFGLGFVSWPNAGKV
jgi:hypothetical protein